jgi:hypothetical protein
MKHVCDNCQAELERVTKQRDELLLAAEGIFRCWNNGHGTIVLDRDDPEVDALQTAIDNCRED